MSNTIVNNFWMHKRNKTKYEENNISKTTGHLNSLGKFNTTMSFYLKNLIGEFLLG